MRGGGYMSVRVHIFLAGGHTHELDLEREDVQLAMLLRAMGANASPSDTLTSPLVRLVHKTGGTERALVFLRRHLIAVQTEPAMLDLLPTVHSARRIWLEHQATVSGSALPIQKAEYHVIHEFFGPLRDELMAWVLEREACFVPARVRSSTQSVSDDYDFRRALQLHDQGPWRERFIARLREVLPEILSALDVTMPEQHSFELSVTAHGHNDYFRAHRDNVTGKLRQRMVSLVYYFFRHPKSFRGGETVLFDTVVDGENKVKGAGYCTLTPRDDSLLAFRSETLHQVKAVRSEDGDFSRSRFTITCWLRDTSIGLS
ncbi:MAG: SM-20-related protein [Kiritimatiellia bacterium]|jgi:SM-20-related protein